MFKTYTRAERAKAIAEVDKAIKDGYSVDAGCNRAGISFSSYYKWRKKMPKYDGNNILETLRNENRMLKEELAALLLEKELSK